MQRVEKLIVSSLVSLSFLILEIGMCCCTQAELRDDQ